MTWDADFYQACVSDTDFNSGITTLSKEYFAEAVAPYATYQLIAANATGTLEGVGLEGVRIVQLNIWAESPTECDTLARYAINGVNTQLDVSSVNQRSLGREDDEELFGLAIDFEIWFQEP